ncbi:uncharacterized protein LOC111073148 isoform X1 [Drosophila obscura]|uniref:uncharacterized protein LOC111073148 isoform X1 n=1 Tax=Drosophila obscura TaxID=7282 RepID=UPI001BB1F6A5|nr:uncharacterized protein LOC111073148 isoform X1 [Drosophila obscura]
MTTENLEQFNADELEAPEWLNADFIGEILSTSEEAPELKVTDLKISPASAQGDHYASVMFRTQVEYTTRKGVFTKPLIIKTMPEQEGHKKDMLSESHFFETEIGMYSKVLPEFQRILKQAGDDTRLYVPCIYHSLEPHQVMIFEDLVPQGYTVIRDRPQPDFLKDFKYGFFDTVGSDPFITTAMPPFIEMLERWPELRKYKPHFEKIKDTYLDTVQTVLQEYRTNPQSDGYYVLCHGDFHLRNMMFRHNKETGDSEDVMLVDFQMCNNCPIAVDLIYSIHMLMEPEQRWSQGEKLINYYFSVLVDTLQKVGYKGEMPTLAKLWQEIHRLKYYDLFMMFTLLPLILGIKTNSFSMNDLLQDGATREKTYHQDVYVKDIKNLLPKYEKIGYFKDL